MYKLHIDEKYKSVYRPNLRIFGIWAQYNTDSNVTHKDEYLKKQNESTLDEKLRKFKFCNLALVCHFPSSFSETAVIPSTQYPIFFSSSSSNTVQSSS